MEVAITWRASVTSGKQDLERLMNRSVTDFFRHNDLPRVELLAFEVKYGADAQRPIKVTHKSPAMGHDPRGVPVIVQGDGKQGIKCLLTVPGMDDDSVQLLLANGPYNRRRRTISPKAAEAAPPTEASPTQPTMLGTDETAEDPSERTPAMEPADDAVMVIKKVPALPRTMLRMPYDALVAHGIDAADIERLKATMASIVYRAGGEEPEEWVQAPVSIITDAIMEHMRLPSNKRGNYQGVVGSFFSTKISLFGLKGDDSSDPDAHYSDWHLHTKLIAEFVGGKENIAPLTKARDEEVRQQRALEAEAEQNPPPMAVEVEEAASEAFMEDALLLDLALKTLEGRTAAEAEVRIAEDNEALCSMRIEELQRQLADAKAALESASVLREAARAKAAQYVLSAEVEAKLRDAKQRIIGLLQQHGI